MIRFVTRHESFREVRNRLLFVLVPVFSILLVVLLWFFSGTADGIAYYIIVLFFAGTFAFVIFNSLQRQKKAHESYALTVDEDGFLREQQYTSD
jgi:hypothetical protein